MKTKKINIDIKDINKNIQKKYGKGFFISNINGLGCYFYYDISRSYYDILFTSPRLKARDLRFLFERNGRKVTASTGSANSNLILKPFASYLEPNIIYEPDTSEVYRVEDHQVEHIYKQAKTLQRAGIINNFKEEKIRTIARKRSRKI